MSDKVVIVRPVVSVIVVNATGGPMRAISGAGAPPMTICSNREALIDATKKGLKALEEREG